MIWLIVLAFFAAWASLNAASRGRSGILWFFFGLMLGPFAVLFSYFVGRKGGEAVVMAAKPPLPPLTESVNRVVTVIVIACLVPLALLLIAAVMHGLH